MMKRVTWFAGGVVAGVATARIREAQGQGHGVADRTLPRWPDPPADNMLAKSRDVLDAVREGRMVMKHTEDELHARRDGRLVSLDEHVGPDDQVFVDGVPVESGRVIVMRPKRPATQGASGSPMSALAAGPAAADDASSRPGPLHGRRTPPVPPRRVQSRR